MKQETTYWMTVKMVAVEGERTPEMVNLGELVESGLLDLGLVHVEVAVMSAADQWIE